jgi:CubicO group peptidase (beta-lactamase class C family)
MHGCRNSAGAKANGRCCPGVFQTNSAGETGGLRDIRPRFLGEFRFRYKQQGRTAPGMSVAVAVDGNLVWAEGFGPADLEQCVPATPETKFRIGSTSKPLTSSGAALLYEQKRLDLDAPIQRYAPSFPDKGQT